MSTIIAHDEQNDQLQSRILNFFREHRVSQLLKQSNFKKSSGFPCLQVLKLVFTLVFTGKNLFRILEQENAPEMKKDTVYRFLDSPHYNWRRLLLWLVAELIQTIASLTDPAKHRHVFVIDDSLYNRARSKSVELLAKVHDHATHRFVRGFRMLTLGWTDGSTFLPVAFSLLSSADPKNRLCEARPVDKRTCGAKRRAESVRKATDVMLELLEEAHKLIPASMVLFDSWFAYPAIIAKIRSFSLHTICRLKSLPTVRYKLGSEWLTLNQLYSAVKKKRGRAQFLASVMVVIPGPDEETIPVKIVFVRNRNRKNAHKWLALLSTDVDLTDEEIVRIYGKRWDIEVFFKVSKSYLALAKEFQNRSYDAITAHTTIVFLRYVMLAMESRNENDPRTIGGLFYACCDEISDIKFADALKIILSALRDCLSECLTLAKEQIEELIDNFINRLPRYIRRSLAFAGCES